jgi:fluoride ion exporter CrcB/FEX
VGIAASTPIDPTTVGLLVALAAVLIVGFKAVKTVLSTFIISGFCGAFYVVSALILDYTLSVNRVLQFAVLGSSIYFGLKMISGIYGTASFAFSVQSRLVSMLTYPVRKLAAMVSTSAEDEED